MSVKNIAERLVELCRKGDFETAQKELFAEDVLSVEPYATPEFEIFFIQRINDLLFIITDSYTPADRKARSI